MCITYAHRSLPREDDTESQGIVYWLQEACRHKRQQLGREPVHIAAAITVNPTTITRFEGHETKFAGLDRIVEAYAIDFEIPAYELCQLAVEAWRGGGLDT